MISFAIQKMFQPSKAPSAFRVFCSTAKDPDSPGRKGFSPRRTSTSSLTASPAPTPRSVLSVTPTVTPRPSPRDLGARGRRGWEWKKLGVYAKDLP